MTDPKCTRSLTERANRTPWVSCKIPHLIGSPREVAMSESFHATTIVSVRRDGKVVIGGDGQVTLGNTIVKANARKLRRLGSKGEVLAGFAGATADAFTLFELFEQKLDKYGNN